MNLCQYSKIFGESNKGAHSIRVFNLAIVDIISTFILALVIKFLFFRNINYFIILLFCFLLGIISHRLFCVKTTVDKILFD